MFTDTFPISYKDINGEMVGHCINTTYISNRPQYIINPRRTGYFRSITNEQYIKFWIGKLELDIVKDQKALEESKANFKEAASNPLLKEAIPELEKQLKGFAKWIDYLKGRKQYFERKLVDLPAEEKKAPAHHALYKNIATIVDKNGKYIEKISGRMAYEPAEAGDTLHKTPIFTFINDPFDLKLPKTAFQLLVIADPYRGGEQGELKELLEKHFYPVLSFKEIAALMYR
jgi:hypothetical protein